jgi:RNA polymerase sigma-70 factor (ECF subfamily)
MDLVQSVHRSLMIGLHEGKFDLAGPDQLIALALTLVRRKAARQWRRHQRQLRLSRGAGETTDLAQMLTALSAAPEGPARAAELNDQIEHLCRDLNPVERRLLALRMQGYSTAEIAQQLDLHPVALRIRMTRLRQRLQASAVLHDWL